MAFVAIFVHMLRGLPKRLIICENYFQIPHTFSNFEIGALQWRPSHLGTSALPHTGIYTVKTLLSTLITHPVKATFAYITLSFSFERL